jgi:hypothetical protein
VIRLRLKGAAKDVKVKGTAAGWDGEEVERLALISHSLVEEG